MLRLGLNDRIISFLCCEMVDSLLYLFYIARKIHRGATEQVISRGNFCPKDRKLVVESFQFFHKIRVKVFFHIVQSFWNKRFVEYHLKPTSFQVTFLLFRILAG